MKCTNILENCIQKDWNKNEIIRKNLTEYWLGGSGTNEKNMVIREWMFVQTEKNNKIIEWGGNKGNDNDKNGSDHAMIMWRNAYVWTVMRRILVSCNEK